MRILLFVLALILGLNIATQPVAAHVLESDNGIGAVIHIDPDDDPIAGQPSTFYFEFKDKNNKLSLSDCDCNVTFRQADTIIGARPLSASRSLTGNATYTLPTQGLYTIDVSGRPVGSASFTAFQFPYSFRVERGVIATSDDGREVTKTSPFLYAGIVLALMVGFGLGARLVYNVKHKSKPTMDSVL